MTEGQHNPRTSSAHLYAYRFNESYSHHSYYYEPISPSMAMKVYCEARPDYYLTESADGVVLAPGNDSDRRQHWMMDDAWGMHVKDEAGFPAFALINISSMNALRHGSAENEQVEILPYDQHHIDEGFLWTLSEDIGNEFRCIRPASNIHLNMDADHGNLQCGGVHHGTKLILFGFNNQENQKWKIVPILSPGFSVYDASSEPDGSHDGALNEHHRPEHGVEGQIVRLYTEARPDLFLTVRNGEVVLAPGNNQDSHQEWVKDDSWGSAVKDEANFPAFALVNKATQEALKHGSVEWDRVELSPYEEPVRDDAVLWTLSADVGHGYQCIRPSSNIQLNLDAKHGDEEHGGVQNGNELILFRFNNQQNQKWKMMVM